MEQAAARRWLMVVYAATVFLSALLLFQVQPIISRYILPWFGGTPAVWTTAMLFFQTLLFAGYAYAHLSVHYLKPLWQTAVHLVLLVAAVVSLPFVPGAGWKPIDGSHPAGRILLLLTASVGLPYFVLATTGPLVQAWFSRTNPGRSPYRLYSLSNVGSLLALLTYPFLIEPSLSLGSQAVIWQWVFWIFAALCAFGVTRTIAASGPATVPAPTPANRKSSPAEPGGGAAAGASHDAPPTWGRRLLWLLLPALASLAFLATTNYVCQDVAVVPFLWIAPLSLYLLSFIICFDHERWYVPRFMAAATLLVYVAAIVYLALQNRYVAEWLHRDPLPNLLKVDIGLCFGRLFCLCMLCHGELVRFKPHPRYLTSFYLMVAAGGAIGGLFVGLVAPLVFNGYGEWYIALAAGLLLTLAILVRTGEGGLLRRNLREFLPASVVLVGAVIAAAMLGLSGGDSSHETLDMRRNFYGVLTVQRVVSKEGDVALRLLNGRITHGLQFTDSERRNLPTTYYGRVSGIGRAIDFFASQSVPNLRVGAIGLGTGTLAAYARPNDQFVFYEINPEVPKISRQYFTYLKDAEQRMAQGRGSLEISMGDARLSLERELTERTDGRRLHVIAVDAFSGDAIPTHLLTRQAGDVYKRHLDPEGVLAIHISNLYLNLAPVVRGLAEHLKMNVIEIDSDGNNDDMVYSAHWILVTNNEKLLSSLASFAKQEDSPPPALLWTDDYSDLVRILK